MLVKLISKEVPATMAVLILVTVKTFPLRVQPTTLAEPPDTVNEQVELV